MAGGQSRTSLNKPCILLIVIAGMERFAFKGVASNLVTYLTDVVKMSNSAAAKKVNNWCGITSMLPLLVAPLADSYLDRYTTVLASSSLYVAGLLALTSLALQWPWPNSADKSGFTSSFSWSLNLISLGQAGYNPSLQAFGADQFDDDEELPSSKNDQSSKKKSSFFQWWYFGICCGSLLGVSIMSYIQDTLGWGLGFAIPSIAMVISVIVFRFGNRFYTHKDGEIIHIKSLGDRIVKAIKAATSRLTCGEISVPTYTNKSNVSEIELEDRPLCQQDSGSKDGADKKSENGINFVKILKVVLPLLPVWTLLLMFAVIFQQPATFFTKQGVTMKRNIGNNFRIPPAALQSSITISIILLMPLYDTFFIPFVRVFTRNEKGITVMQRMGIGMFLSVIAMIIAAVTERKRLEISRNLVTSSETVPMSIFWLLPQYILLGISDIFTVVGMQEFFYSEVPINMRTLGIALYTSVFGCGSFFSSFLISVIEKLTSTRGAKQNWFADDMRKARFDNYYWFLALSSAASFLLFMVFCRFYRSRTIVD
ncbi:protein NRT1/ PTR FAMILY 5.8 [Nicotiana tomentosiformis]|uniref:protein NRT1/ PTR FAMILY 5.8 n=1 Tax=Nicotiana tomentosiformis TaxID=4098 RepID=UPI00051B7CE7|nr:protein NRT1/ PTR FAMILY 5.8 [Nicotiana tomentosiformis]